MAQPALAPRFEVPTNRSVDARLLAGAALFGVGWGLARLLSRPALAGLSLGLPEVALFRGGDARRDAAPPRQVALRRVTRVSSDGRPSRRAKPGQSPVPLLT